MSKTGGGSILLSLVCEIRYHTIDYIRWDTFLFSDLTPNYNRKCLDLHNIFRVCFTQSAIRLQCHATCVFIHSFFLLVVCHARNDFNVNARIHGCHENVPDSQPTPTAIFPIFFHGLLFRLTLWICIQNLKSVSLPVPELIGGCQKNSGRSLAIPELSIPPKFCMPTMQSAHYSRMCPRFPAIFDCRFEWGLWTSNLGKGWA